MELDWIDDFLTLEQTRNFTRAAQLRHTTQSAYSRRIMRLEEWMGCTLFLRDTRPVEMTPEGREFLPRARAMRADMLDARRAAQSITSHYPQSFRIYTTNTLAIGFLPRWLATQENRPCSIVVASVTACLEAITSGVAQMAIIPTFPDDSLRTGLTQKKLGQDRLHLVAHTEMATCVKIKKDVITGPVMMYTPGTRYGQVVDACLTDARLNLEQDPVCESPSAEALLAQVNNRYGAAWIPKTITGPTLKRCLPGEKLDIPYDIICLTSS